ncbi:hypothetical protein CHS0354_008568 [Potamilus streckersoni]|uniref:Uncharacterized protein n=1 Tax=Potamilus streckersoni TaxID=2493646 RepID=A0AAE0RSD1_9BIVA|nr:hypothetical protein CHS0354_008568 [Potamilus streckersoni]
MGVRGEDGWPVTHRAVNEAIHPFSWVGVGVCTGTSQYPIKTFINGAMIVFCVWSADGFEVWIELEARKHSEKHELGQALRYLFRACLSFDDFVV